MQELKERILNAGSNLGSGIQVDATLVGIGTVVEKEFEHGRENARGLNVPIESLAVVINMDDGKIELGG